MKAVFAHVARALGAGLTGSVVATIPAVPLVLMIDPEGDPRMEDVLAADPPISRSP